jgi:hypothetical protein
MIAVNDRTRWSRDEDLAERLVDALCVAPLREWRSAALALALDPRATLAATALEIALPSVDHVRLWDLLDDLETALHRLASDEACGIVHGRRECDCIRVVTERAVEGLLCAECLARDDVEALAGALVALLQINESESLIPPPDQ